MSVSVEDVKNVAHLARLGVSTSEIDEMCSKLNQILHFVDQLNEVNCSGGCEVVECAFELHERADIAKPCDQSVMDNAPQKVHNMFVVPKIVG